MVNKTSPSGHSLAVALPGGLIAGLLWDRISPEATFIYGVALAVISVAIILTVKKRTVEAAT